MEAKFAQINSAIFSSVLYYFCTNFFIKINFLQTKRTRVNKKHTWMTCIYQLQDELIQIPDMRIVFERKYPKGICILRKTNIATVPCIWGSRGAVSPSPYPSFPQLFGAFDHKNILTILGEFSKKIEVR